MNNMNAGHSDPTVYSLTIATLLILIMAGRSSLAMAENGTAIDCTVEAYHGTLFADFYEYTKQTADRFCTELIRSRIDRSSIDERVVGNTLVEFANRAEQRLDTMGLAQSADYQSQFAQLKQDFGNFRFTDMRLPELKIFGTARVEGFFEPLSEDIPSFTINQVDRCETILPGTGCKAIFSDFADAFNPYRSAYDTIYDNTARLESMGRRWDRFLEISKSQTLLEVYFTTLAHRDRFRKNHLVGPPDYQVIALHPQLIYDSMNNAADGSNQETGLALEWLGVNFWNWKVPLGLSFTSVYVDRAGARDTGNGVMLHVYNHYAFGWARHGDDDSFYVTLDLLKLFEDSKRQYDAYLDQYYH